MTDPQHAEEIERLWRAIRRDLSTAILQVAGVAATNDNKALTRFERNWERLCDFDLDLAAMVYHGVDELAMAMARRGKPNSPADHRMRQLSEVVGLAELGRQANPDADASTVGDLVRLGEDAIRRQVDIETEGPR